MKDSIDKNIKTIDGLSIGDKVVPKFHKGKEYKRSIYQTAKILGFVPGPGVTTLGTPAAVMKKDNGGLWMEHTEFLKRVV